MVVKFSPAIAGVLSGMVYVYDGLYKGMSDLSEVLGGPALVFETGNCKPSGFSPLVIAWGQTGIATE